VVCAVPDCPSTFPGMQLLLRTLLRFFMLIEFFGLGAALLSGSILAFPLMRGPRWMDVLAGVVAVVVGLVAAVWAARALDRWHDRLERAAALRTGLH
jgi:hypothetical protein